jgi:polysaccharide deacetylase 2 family uncharacterized protein YibQ
MKKYRIIILVLSIIVFLETILFIYFLIIRPKKIIKVPVEIKGKIAIVIDDWGYSLNNLSIINRIKYPLTCAVLPHLNYTYKVSQELDSLGFEIILHLPMEPYEKYNLEKNTITTSMDEETIKNILNLGLTNLFNPKGVSNHMGSKATEGPRVMGIIFKELKKRKLYFFDSFVTSKSVCSGLAKKINLGFARRDIFLDNKNSPEYIRGQIYKLKTKARIYGQAIGVGHDREVTLELLSQIMPELEKDGYKFVFLSELVR